MYQQHTNSDSVKKLLKKSKLRLDIGCGFNPQPGFVSMDKRKEVKPDVLHDIEKFPYPLPNDSCSVVVMSHVIEHVKPWLTLDVMNELWRIISPDGVLMLATPYATSFGYYQDPTHCNPWNEATPAYFDPKHESGLYNIYKPKPWKIEKCVWIMNGNMEIVLRKVRVHSNGA